jgi:osmoprotectant transport system permease protein
MNLFELTGAWFVDPANWTGPAGIPARLAEHLFYSGLTLVIAAAIAVPLGLYVGHTGKGRIAVVGLASGMRALPTLGLLTLFVTVMGLGLLPPIYALVILAIPPLLAGAYSGIAAVDRPLVDAARAMGMTEWQVLFRAEMPNALPVMLGGLRGAVLQVIATVSIVAYINLGGFGRYLIDGLAVRDPVRLFAGALLIAALALVADAVLAVLQKLAVSPGVRGAPSGPKGRTSKVGAASAGR